MSDYNLFGLSPRSFEQMVQALCVPLFGPEIVVFGDGPDGGREATFQGPVLYPSAEGSWNGYGVVQAKFLQRTSDVASDGDWAIAQLRSELDDYSNGGRRKPEYYVFVTNVVLSAVDEKGRKDKLYALLSQKASSLGIKGWDVWDYDKLRAFLDNNRDVARAFAAGITPGDVLSKMADMLNSIPQFTPTMTNFLQKELLSEQYAALEQAGHDPDEKILLSRVFIDVPVAPEKLYEPAEDGQAEMFVSFAVQAASAKCNFGLKNSPSTDIGRMVLIGGPGQGKTTVGQYLCQLHRAAILADAAGLTSDARRVVESIQASCLEQSLPMPSFRRFPFRLELRSFAAELASGTSQSVFAHILKRISTRTSRPITDAQLRDWFGSYPWLIVFDGLDEVPLSSNRRELLAAIKEFWIDLSECKADVFVLATSRPQGYSDEFSPTDYNHWYLAPLSTDTSLLYGRLLTETRYGRDTERAAKIYSRLERASTTSATARLMRSPLQVTIMTTLVDKLGQPPDQRWSLFRDYYRTIYDREVERDIPASEILRTKRPDVDLIHYRLGVLLQIESERKGTTDAKLNARSFELLVEAKLKDEGFVGKPLESLVEAIVRAAAERLVFIVGLEADQVGFEIRSLQEFMAAEGLMEGSDEVVKERLRHIAPLESWKQVFLFATGKCFLERRHLREFVFTLCSELDLESSGVGTAVVLMGSSLALDILEEGSARDQPKYQTLLALQALRLLDVPDSRQHVRLAGLYEGQLSQEYRVAIRTRMGQADPAKRIGAWTCLLELCKKAIGWAEEDYRTYATSLAEQATFLSTAIAATNPDMQDLKRDVLRCTAVLSNRNSHAAWWKVGQAGARVTDGDWYGHAVTVLNSDALDKCRVSVTFGEASGLDGLTLGYIPTCANSFTQLLTMPQHHAEWDFFLLASEFAANPTKETLASVSEKCARLKGNLSPSVNRLPAPWPLRALFPHWSTPDQALWITERIRAGELGDTGDWLSAEDRWKHGVRIEELSCEKNGLPFTADISKWGLPPDAVVMLSLSHTREAPSVADLVASFAKMPAGRGRNAAASFTLFDDRLMPTESPLDAFFCGLLEDAAEYDWAALSEQQTQALMNGRDWKDRLNQIGSKISGIYVDAFNEEQGRKVLDVICTDPNKGGLLRLVGFFAASLGLRAKCDLSNYQEGVEGVRRAKLILRLLSEPWTSADVPALVRTIIEISKEANADLADILQAIDKAQASIENRAELLVSLFDVTPTKEQETRRELYLRLGGTLALRKSHFQQVALCELTYLAPG